MNSIFLPLRWDPQQKVQFHCQILSNFLKISKSKNIKIQVGHVERFNSAYRAVKDEINNPMFIESHRLAKFNPRGTDVSVVLDLMIHDIDIILSCVNSKIKYISSSGVSIISKSPSIYWFIILFQRICNFNDIFWICKNRI